MKWIAPALFFATSAAAAPVDTWSGATENACNGRCSLEWAISTLPADRAAAAREAIAQPAQRLSVANGSYVSAMAYFKDGAASMDTGGTVVFVGTGAAPAEGWKFGEWSLVKLDACSNWAVVEHKMRVRVPSSNRVHIAQNRRREDEWTPEPADFLITPGRRPARREPVPAPQPAAVPIPASAFNFALGLGVLGLLRKGKKNV